MAEKKEYDEGRRKTALAFSIILGVLIGVFIKRVHIGLLIGLAIGLFSASLIRKK